MAHANGSSSEPDCSDYHHAVDVEQFRKQAYQMVDFICDYHKNMEQHPVLPAEALQPGYLRSLLPAQAPQTPQPFADIMQDVKEKIMPGVTHWQSPKFYAYYPANSSFPGILGEMLSAAFNVIGFSWRGCPAATDLETVVLDWLAKLLNLPVAFWATQPDGSRGPGGGVIQGTASEASLVALLAARAKALGGRPPEDALKLVAYSSDQAHSCLKKACMVAGIQHCRLLLTEKEHAWALQPATVKEALDKDLAAGLIPFFLSATCGTTSSCAFDPLQPLGMLSDKYGIWMHVDAAYAGVSAMLPECAGHFEGVELVHSFNTNPHKWMLTNFDSSALFVRDAGPLKQALTLNPSFLQNKTNEYDYKDWQVPLGRRFRSLKLWFVLRSYGTEGLQSYLRHHIALAQNFASRIEHDPRFRLAAPQNLSLVCFVLADGGRKQNAALLDAVNASGQAFLIHTELGGEFVLRLAIGAASTQLRHIDAVWRLLCSEADKILGAVQNGSAAA